MPKVTDIDAAFMPIFNQCRLATMTTPERLYALYKAVEYISAASVAGDVVECGVWRGGSMMCAALTLLRAGDAGRRLYLYDTFEGMPPADPRDVDVDGRCAIDRLAAEQRSEDSSIWCYAPLEAVDRNMASTGYPQDRITYVMGLVEETIPDTTPEVIALLRLDTDWYESTRHELEHLVPRLARGGVVIIDDYGHWEGVRQAVDEYFATSEVKILLNRVDSSCRIGVRA